MTTPNPTRKLFFGLFVFPLLIAVGMAILLCSVVLLTHESQTPESLVASIKTGAAGKRAQKAYELSNELNLSKGRLDEPTLKNEIIYILTNPDRYDPMTRRYMTIALSHFKGSDVNATLRAAMHDKDADVQLYALWSLGVVGATEVSDEIAQFLDSDNPDLRKMSAYVIGALGNRSYNVKLKNLLQDPVLDVQWNAALALARLGDASGNEILSNMLDRSTYIGSPMREEDIEKTMINAAKGLALTKSSDSLSVLTPVARTEKSLKVRQAAMDAMNFIRKERSV